MSAVVDVSTCSLPSVLGSCHLAHVCAKYVGVFLSCFCFLLKSEERSARETETFRTTSCFMHALACEKLASTYSHAHAFAY